MNKRERELKAQLNAAREELRVDRLEIQDLQERVAILTLALKQARPDQPRDCPFPEFNSPIHLDQVEAAI